MALDYLFDFLLLPVLFFIGLVTSYQDFRYGKIKNKWIILGMAWGLGIYILCIIWALIFPYLSQIFPKISFFILPSYILKVFINSAFALIVGYLLWSFDFWSAGDAKLFLVFSLLLPLKYYWKSALPYFPSFALLINIFIPALLFLMAQNLFYFLKSISISKIVSLWNSSLSKFKINYFIYLKTFFGFFLIFLTFQIIKLELGNIIGQSGFWQIGIIFLVTLLRKSLNKAFQKNWFLILFFLGIILYLVYGYFSYVYPMLNKLTLLTKDSLFFMVIFIVISLLLSVVEESQKKHLPFAIWVLTGALITIILKGSLLSFVMKIK